MKTSRLLCWSTILAISLIAIAACANADPASVYWLQDDVVFTFGTPGEPLSSGTSVLATGRIVEWETNWTVARFRLEAKASAAKTDLGDEWLMDFDTLASLAFRDDMTGELLWQGSFDHFYVRGYHNTSMRYNISEAGYTRPDFVDDPSRYTALGSLTAYKGSGQHEWNTAAFMVKLGFYDINFGGGRYNEIYREGNSQGVVTAVPEPSAIVGLLAGVAGMFGAARRKLTR